MAAQVATKLRTRWTVARYCRIRGQAIGALARLVRERWSHEKLLEERTRILSSEDALRMPSHVHAEILGMFRGATDMLHTSGLVEWCHYHQGRYVNSEEFHKLGAPYSEIDPGKSRHVWRGTQEVFFEPNT